MALLELFVAALIVGISLVDAGIPIAAWHRTKESRFLWVSAGGIALAIFGGIAGWAELPPAFGGPPEVPLYALVSVFAAAALLLVSTVWPRRT